MRVLFCILACSVLACAQASQSSLPVGTIPVGDSPFALALNANNSQAVAVNLFPPRLANGTDGPNVKVINTSTRAVTGSFLAGTRLVAIAVTGTTALIINEDQNAVRLIDVSTAKEITAVNVGSRPSNVAVVSANMAVVTNGTSGDISFVD